MGDPRLSEARAAWRKASPKYREWWSTRLPDACALCGKPLGARWEIDHRVPLHAGGDLGVKNQRITHASCNRSKGASEGNARRRPAHQWSEWF